MSNTICYVASTKCWGEGDGHLVDVIGAYEAEQDLTVIHRIFLRMANPSFVLEKASDYWRRFYDVGTWRVTRRGKAGAIGILEGVDNLNPTFARYLHAYVQRMWQLVGARQLRSRYQILHGKDGKTKLRIEGAWN